MLGRTHEIGGIVSVLAADVALKGIHLTPSTALFSLFAGFMGALTPDLDKPTSLIYHKIPAGSLIGKIIHPVFIGGHRHISHSIIGFALFALGSHWLLFKYVHVSGIDTMIIWLSYLIGIASHFFLDSITDEGIPLLFPFKFHFGLPPIRALRITTGSWVEHLVVVPLLLISIVYIYAHYYYIFNR